MGYKSVIRSMNASANRWARESERESNRQRRESERSANIQRKENERNAKKAQKIQDKQDAIFDELTKLYAAGKVDKKQFEDLKERQNDIAIDFLAVSGAPFITLAKRYITGKIDKEEFDALSYEILPPDFIEERKQIVIDAEARIREFKEFTEKCNQSTGCKYCGKKGFFTSLTEYKEIQLCKKHLAELQNICTYQYYGQYFNVYPVDIIELNESGSTLSLKFKIESAK